MATTKPAKKQSDEELLATVIDQKLSDPNNINEKTRWAAVRIGGIVGHGQVLRTPAKDKTMISFGLKTGKYFTIYGVDVAELRRKAEAHKLSAGALGNTGMQSYWTETQDKLDAEPTKSKLALVSGAIKRMTPGVKTSGGEI